MTLYETVVDTSVVNTSHSIVVDLVGENKSVLDVGCATGYLAEVLNERGCTVSGIEYDAKAADRARLRMANVVVGDLNTMPLSQAFAGQTFDRIIFGDVLEHLQDPAAVLRSAASLLAPDGEVVISIPNVAHGALRLALLQGRWKYNDTGLLDRTHIRFFSLRSLFELLDEAGFAATEVRATVVDPLNTEIEISDSELPDGIIEWVRHQPQALDYQYVLSVVPSDDLPGPRVQVVPAVPHDEVRLDDGYSARARMTREEQHRMLRIRDHVIGLEASAARNAASLEKLRERNDELQKELADVAEDRRRIKASFTWRVGMVASAPVRLVRGMGRSAR